MSGYGQFCPIAQASEALAEVMVGDVELGVALTSGRVKLRAPRTGARAQEPPRTSGTI
jgi:hypothetical protein